MYDYGYSDELKHWKYIKKIKVNGKWRYFYDENKAKMYDHELITVSKDKDGNRKTTEYKKSDKIYSSNTTFGNGHRVIKNQGATERLQAKGERYIYNKILSKSKHAQRAGDFSEKVKRGLDWYKKNVVDRIGFTKRNF